MNQFLYSSRKWRILKQNFNFYKLTLNLERSKQDLMTSTWQKYLKANIHLCLQNKAHGWTVGFWSMQAASRRIAPISPKEKTVASSREINAHTNKAAAPRANRIASERWRSAISSNSRSSLASVGLLMVFNLILDAFSTLLNKFAMTLPSICWARLRCP